MPALTRYDALRAVLAGILIYALSYLLTIALCLPS